MRKYIFILLLALFSNLSFAKDWKIIDEQMVTNTCIFEQYEDYLVTNINNQDVSISKAFYDEELILVTWSNDEDTVYTIRPIYKKEMYKDIKFILKEFNNIIDTLNKYPEALNSIKEEYLKILWYNQKY